MTGKLSACRPFFIAFGWDFGVHFLDFLGGGGYFIE